MSSLDDLKKFIITHVLSPDGEFYPRTQNRSWWVQHGAQVQLDQINSMTLFVPGKSIRRRCWHVLHDCWQIPVCAECKLNAVKWHLSTGSYSVCCSPACSSKHSAPQRQQTCQERYGADNPSKVQRFVDQIATTTRQRYGVDNYAQTADFRQSQQERWAQYTQQQRQEIRERTRETCVIKYGADSTLASDDIKQKIRNSMQERHGVCSPLQSPAIRRKQQETMLAKFGRISHSQQHLTTEFIDNLSDPDWLQDQLRSHSLRDLAEMNHLSYSHMCKIAHKHGLTVPQQSDWEREVALWLTSLGIEVETHKKIQGAHEVDIYLPQHRLAIECNGIFWHSEHRGRKAPDYHLRKTQWCAEQNIRLIHLWDTEWYHKNHIVKSRIQSVTGRAAYRVAARKTTVVQLTAQQSGEFFDQNHIQGSVNSRYSWGLVDLNGTIVAAMSWGKSRYNSQYQWEMLRFCNCVNTVVVGGASRLFARFCQEIQPESIISYADRRWNTGEVYAKLGFAFVKNTPPGYYYTQDYRRLENRVKYQKHKLASVLENFSAEKTEWQNMLAAGWDRIWDVGQAVWDWHREPVNALPNSQFSDDQF
jgi:G:T-mismatch repair DNA endonuclease (very short patch repair protein)